MTNDLKGAKLNFLLTFLSVSVAFAVNDDG